MIPERAARFGAKHAHIVAHSKGGLDSRDFIAGLPNPSAFGVLSLTTLVTPHHGSVGADYQIAARRASALASDNPTRVGLARLVPPNPGTESLTITEVEDFNQTNRLPEVLRVDGESRPVAYGSVSADADVNGDGTIQVEEGRGIPAPSQWLLTQLYNLMGRVQSVHVETLTMPGVTVRAVREVRNEEFEPNDLLVTATSARHERFAEIEYRNGAHGNNHANIANPEVGRIVLTYIKTVQPVR